MQHVKKTQINMILDLVVSCTYLSSSADKMEANIPVRVIGWDHSGNTCMVYFVQGNINTLYKVSVMTHIVHVK